ncbi:basic leucine zipper 43-like [Fagus crenata]
MEQNDHLKELHDLHANPLQHSHSIFQTHKHNPISSLLNMQPAEVLGGHHSLSLSNPSQNPDSMPFYFTTYQTHIPLHEFSPNTFTDTTSDEAKVLQQSIINEKRLKRIISNRDSARRSRIRKKKQIEELQYQVEQVQIANQQLSEKVIQLLESNQQILQENVQLKEKVSSLQMVLTELLLPPRNVNEVTSNNANRIRAETSK